MARKEEESVAPVSKTSPSLILQLGPQNARRALNALVAGLEGAGFTVRLEAAGHAPVDPEIERVLAFEQALYRHADRPGDLMQIPESAAGEGLLIALADARPDADLVLWLDGEPGLGRLERSLVNGHVPLAELKDRTGAVRAAGVPGIERPEVLGRALAAFFARLATLILMALDGKARQLPDRKGMREPPRGATPLAFFLRHAAEKVAGRVAPARRRKEHWRIGVRPIAGNFRPDADAQATGYHVLPDDGARYYADPILWDEGDRSYLLMEEFPYDTGIGCLAFTELGPEGQALFAPRRILERPTHLSYPFLFRHGGEIYMLPENAAAGALTLYRARHFPDLWEEHSLLMPGRALHDATLLGKDGRWWLLANEERGSSSWDTLVIFSAESPLGPYTPHPLNPVLVDARLARSGGPIIEHEGRLIRPVQSCLGGYGRFLRFTEITGLDAQGFSQREIGRLLPETGRRISGLHTYARSARFEAIDFLTTRRWNPA